MSTAAAAGSHDENVDTRSSSLLAQSTAILTVMKPDLDPSKLQQIAWNVAELTQVLSDSSQTFGEFRTTLDRFQQFIKTLPPGNQLQFNASLQAFREEQQRILDERKVTLAHPCDPDTEQEIHEAAVRSAAKGRDAEQTCRSCHTPKTETLLQRCSRCKTAIYCSRECQVADWKRHKFECVQIGATQT